MKDAGMSMPEWNPYSESTSRMAEGQGSDMMMMGFQKQVPCLLRGADSLSEKNGQMKASSLNASRFAALPGQAEGCFLPALMMGASKGGSNGEVALKFIEYALGEEIQNVNMREGFPINTKALDAMQADNDEDGRHSSWSAGSPTIGMWRATWLDQAQRDQLRGIIDRLKTPVIPDFTLVRMIVSESTPFFDGKIDASEAAANVCAKANAYLSE
jgi:ABC-type glycerol-3-phosphate transport system substrate-binding protein